MIKNRISQAARWILVGDDFRFGARRAGDLAVKRIARGVELAEPRDRIRSVEKRPVPASPRPASRSFCPSVTPAGTLT